MLLKVGSSGQDVQKLQEKLGITADGSFGPGTEAKVKEWQTINGLTPDGIVGDTTWNKLFTQKTIDIPESIFKLEKLIGIIPEQVILQIPSTATKFDISTVNRLSHFLAQCSHESAGFKAVSENLNYSADGLKSVFGKYFPGSLNESYAKKPIDIANRIYASRMGNGPEGSGDGWRYHGRGFIQLTGKENYAKFSKYIGEDCIANPDLVATKYPLSSAAFFFSVNGLWSICDKGSDETIITAVSKRVNGGLLGIEDRISRFKQYFSLLA